MTTKELFEDYAQEWYINRGKHNDRCEEIIKEIEASIRKEVVEDVLEIHSHCMDGENQYISLQDIKEYALSKGITLK